MEMSVTKKKSEWISSSFESSTQSFQSKTNRPLKRKNDDRAFGVFAPCSTSGSSKTSSQVPWTEKYCPVTENDLAVHKKKIAEVKDWLLKNLTSQKKNSNILVLTGPAGVGKSATIDVLRRDLNLEVQEWNTPVTNTYEEYSTSRDFRVLSTDSQKKQFHNFLLRANKYPTLSISGQNSTSPVSGRKIILVEDIPNVFYKNVKDFHDILRQFQASSRSPLIFIISDCYLGQSSLYSLFPKRIQIELKVSCISFNSIANTSLMKTMVKIINAESQMSSKHFKSPNKDALDLIIASSNGDIRTCINSLQFYCTNKSSSKESSAAAKNSNKFKTSTKNRCKSKTSETDKTVLFGKDTSIFLFRALGKILYCKRDKAAEFEKSEKLPEHFKRDRLLVDPEEVVEKTHVQSETFTLYLHQNYPGFYSNIHDASSASQFFSDADLISGNWSTREVLRDYSSSIATRGVMFTVSSPSNTPTGAATGGWRPLHKPQWFETFKQENSNKRTSEDLFYDLRHPSVDLHCEVLPFIAKTNVPLRTPSHISFVQMMTYFNVNAVSEGTALGQQENDTADADENAMLEEEEETPMISQQNDVNHSLSRATFETQKSNEEFDSYEENLIEDFSDEDDFVDLLLE